MSSDHASYPAPSRDQDRQSTAVLRKIARGSSRRIELFLTGFRRKFYGPITHVATTVRAAALTFDDGPHPEYTAALLRVLERYGAKATFFMIGETARRYPDLIKIVADQGHAIANHSLTHRPFPSLSARARTDEIVGCEEVLRPYSTRLFRPPYGLENAFTHHDATRLGYRVIKWSVSVDDWRDHTPDWLAGRLAAQLTAGSIVLLHDNRIDDSAKSQMNTIYALEEFLQTAGKGYQFCTVPRLLQLGQPMTSFHPVW
jgi:peptidoglycan/xylan/chitin deacetylase (PgdA/CDA1 family)